MVSIITVLPDRKESEIGRNDQEASPSAGKNTGVIFVPCSRMEARPYNSGSVVISEVPGCHLLLQMSSQRRS